MRVSSTQGNLYPCGIPARVRWASYGASAPLKGSERANQPARATGRRDKRSRIRAAAARVSPVYAAYERGCSTACIAESWALGAAANGVYIVSDLGRGPERAAIVHMLTLLVCRSPKCGLGASLGSAFATPGARRYGKTYIHFLAQVPSHAPCWHSYPSPGDPSSRPPGRARLPRQLPRELNRGRTSDAPLDAGYTRRVVYTRLIWRSAGSFEGEGRRGPVQNV